MEEGYAQEALDRADLTPEQRALLTAPVEVTVTGGQTREGEAMGLSVHAAAVCVADAAVFPVVLLYGQSTAAKA
ncbi:MAG: hypothetical protein ACLSHM_01600 [Vescimonas sp.]